MASEPYPVLTQDMKPGDIPAREWVECAACLESSRDQVNPRDWAVEHLGLHPGHFRYRVITSTNWRIEPVSQ